ncbi:hypothetical protein EV361DRAFT_183549 [Lentinula raphanica]|nr:hypothetical protein EV361DRAFT_183549 [Lentinula raphanica]
MATVSCADISLYSQFSISTTIKKPFLTRPQTSRRSSTWEVPLAKSVVNRLACEAGSDLQVPSAALLVQTTRDVFTVDHVHEAELEDIECSSDDDSDSGYGANVEHMENILPANEPEYNASVDDDVLLGWNSARNAIVIDSTTPWLTPHIVISPASDTMSDLAVAWANQVSYYQDSSRLCLPALDLVPKPAFPYSYIPPIATSLPPFTLHPTPVFSSLRFNAMIESCSDERLNYFNVVIAIRRQTFKAVAIIASQFAATYRKRYDIALPFSNIDRPFQWSDPAEPFLSTSRFLRATIVLDSPNPFRIPHIIINQAPPEDEWLTDTNALNDPQDYGFGRYLVVQARGVHYVNEPEDDYYALFASGENEYYDITRFDDERFDGSVTSDMEHEQYGGNYTGTLDHCGFSEELPELDTESLHSVESPLLETPDAVDDDDYFDYALESALAKQNLSSEDYRSSGGSSYTDGCTLERPACRPFDENEEVAQTSVTPSGYSWADDEDELPSLDDEWYQSVIRRTQGVAGA